ncbi:uncharacterized protein [Aquarana catesbeiana]|uniref:uncharacterized protein n=1 Tax=Aquarana catesbeiana TaxID=8400 RepID=UPI003CC96C4D
MLVIPALLICALFRCCQLGICDSTPCPGPAFVFLGSCYRLVDQGTDFWRARESCSNCGGQLAIASENSVLTFLRDHLNGTSWWVGQDIEADILWHGDADVQRLCPTLSYSGVLQEAPCLQHNGFICQTDGQSCSTERSNRSATPMENHVQRQLSSRRTKRFVISQADAPDILQMAFQQVQKPLIGGHNLTSLLILLNHWIQDEEDTNTTQLNYTLSLLDQLTDTLTNPDIRSSDLFTNLSNVVYFGVNSIVGTVLSSCSQITWTTQEIQFFTNSALDILNNLQLATLANFSGPVILQTPLFSMLLSSVNSSAIGSKIFSFPGQSVKVVFPSQSALQSLLSNLLSVQIQMMSFAKNPFIIDPSFNVTGTVIGLSVLSENQEIGVHNLTDNFQVCGH